jgi:hypothetical protein
VHIDALLPFDRVQVMDSQGKLLHDSSFSLRRSVDLPLDHAGTVVYALWRNGRLMGQGRVVREP